MAVWATAMTTAALRVKALGNATQDEFPGAVGPNERQQGMVIVSAFSQHRIEGRPVHGVEYEQTIATTTMRAARQRTRITLPLGAMTVPGEICRK